MGEMKHTPGPWEIDDELQVCAHGQVIAAASFLGTDRDTEATSNAVLIVAAPDLLAALKMLVQVHRDLDTIGAMPADKAIAYGKAEAAIAKAEGH